VHRNLAGLGLVGVVVIKASSAPGPGQALFLAFVEEDGSGFTRDWLRRRGFNVVRGCTGTPLLLRAAPGSFSRVDFAETFVRPATEPMGESEDARVSPEGSASKRMRITPPRFWAPGSLHVFTLNASGLPLLIGEIASPGLNHMISLLYSGARTGSWWDSLGLDRALTPLSNLKVCGDSF